MRNIPTDNLSYGLLISISGGGSGSGYFVNTSNKTFLVTAKHVLFNEAGNLRGDTAEIIAYTKDIEHDETIEFVISLKNLMTDKAILQNGKDDVAVICWGDKDTQQLVTLRKHIQLKGNPKNGPIGAAIENLKSLDAVLISNDVYIIGYPSSVGLKNIPQLDYKTPLVRKGIVAGKNKKLNTIILDCEVYPGNSGGPVIEVERDNLNYKYKLIGTISQYIPFALSVKDGTHKDTGYALNNSGYSVIVPCDPVIEIINNHT
jgi:S1-C subfamily serine protease